MKFSHCSEPLRSSKITTGDLSSITDTLATYTDDWKNIDGGAAGTNSTSSSTATTPSLYGREQEALQLFGSYRHVLRTAQAQTVIVHGESGFGKTALVEILREPASNNHDYFVTGKYVQNSAVQEPYSAIMAAFSDLCDLNAQSADFDETRRVQIQKELGPYSPLLVKTISNLSPFIGDARRDVLEVETSFVEFKGACTSFLRAMTSNDHRAIIFLDDIQWADKGSRLLIEAFLQDTELKNVMLILAYRDEESAQVIDILEHTRDPVNIALTRLDPASVHQMVCSILRSLASTDNIRQLSNIVAKRTAGNPFHVQMFVDVCEQEGLLAFDPDIELWVFDVDTIQETMMVSETLAGLLTRKIGLISPEVKETLKVASLLGYRFDGSILVKVACAFPTGEYSSNNEALNSEVIEASQKAVFLSLSKAMKGGYIESCNDGYHFTHDKLQASFQSLFTDGEEERLHKLIGEAYLDQKDDNHSAVYSAAVHLNCAHSLLQSKSQKKHLAEINLDAAKYCEEQSAFVNAMVVLRKGLGTLGHHERWSTENFQLTFEMMEHLANNEHIIGDFEACKKTVREGLQHCTTVEMKTKLLLIDVTARSSRQGVDDGFETASRTLRALGVKIPHKVSAVHVVMKLLKVKLMLTGKSDEDLRNLPNATNVVATTTVKLLMIVCSFLLLTKDKKAAVFSALLAMQVTLKSGLSPHSPFAFSIYAVMEMSLGNADRAYRFSKLSLTMLNEMNSQEAACPTVGCSMATVVCWKEPTLTLVDHLEQVGIVGFNRGDLVYGNFCTAVSYVMQSILGVNLDYLENAMRDNYKRISRIDEVTLLLWHQPYLQHTIKMRSEGIHLEDIGVLSGEVMDEEHYFQQAEEAKNPAFGVIALRAKVQEAVFFDQFDLAILIFEKIESLTGIAASFSHGVPNSYWLAARANSEVYETTGNRRYLKKARKYTKLLQRMENTGNPNVSSYLIFLSAEEASRRKSISDSELYDVYNDALDRLADSDFLHLEGLLSERACFDFARRGRGDDARLYFQRAIDVFQNKWGSIAKCNSLQEKNDALLSSLQNDDDAVASPPLCGLSISIGPSE